VFGGWVLGVFDCRRNFLSYWHHSWVWDLVGIFLMEWQDLTDQEILDALGVISAEEVVFRVARAVERALREKNSESED